MAAGAPSLKFISFAKFAPSPIATSGALSLGQFMDVRAIILPIETSLRTI